MITYAVVNQKGGVAKTTTTYNLAYIKASQGYRVLMIDLDPQGDLTFITHMKYEYEGKDVSGAIEGLNPTECVYKLDHMDDNLNLFIMPSDIGLANTELQLIMKSARERKLKKVLKKLEGYFDYVFIDCPPSLSILTMNGLIAADSVIIPCQTEGLSYKGYKALISTIRQIQEDDDLNPNLKIAGVIATKFRMLSNEHKQVLSFLISSECGFLGVVKEATITARGIDEGTPVCYHSPKCEVSQSYFDIAKLI